MGTTYHITSYMNMGENARYSVKRSKKSRLAVLSAV